MAPLQQFLLAATRLGTPGQSDGDDGEWFTLVVNDPEELHQPRTTIGLRVKVRKVIDESPHAPLPDRFEIVEFTTYNR